MQRTLQRAQETWICSKNIFLQLTINISIFNHSKQDKSKRTCKGVQTIFIKFTQELHKKTKLTNVVLTFYNFPEIIYAIDNISDRAYVNTLKP